MTEPAPPMRRPPFLRAEWRHLAVLNYAVDRALLAPHVPAGTELDDWNGEVLASLVGFLFLRSRIRGVRVPFHAAFEEVNLRFYVRRRVDGGWRRAVTFLRELVPRRTVAFFARALYGEAYRALPMRHSIELRAGDAPPARVTYAFGRSGAEGRIDLRPEPEGRPTEEDSLEQFVAEHYFGYARQRDGTTLEYEVEHPPWSVARAEAASFTGDGALFAPGFGDLDERAPDSAFYATGSAVAVHAGRRLPAP